MFPIKGREIYVPFYVLHTHNHTHIHSHTSTADTLIMRPLHLEGGPPQHPGAYGGHAASMLGDACLVFAFHKFN